MLISKLVLNRVGQRADVFFKTNHTSYHRFSDEEILVVTEHEHMGSPVGVAGVPFSGLNWVLVERNGLLTDFGFLRFDDFEVFDPVVNMRFIPENSERYVEMLKNKVRSDVLDILLERVKKKEYERIIGLGPGLTPLGDDVLSGMILAGLDVSIDLKTNEISARQMEYASLGMAPYPVKRFLEEGEEELLLKMGATSGIGWALGISLFFEMEG